MNFHLGRIEVGDHDVELAIVFEIAHSQRHGGLPVDCDWIRKSSSDRKNFDRARIQIGDGEIGSAIVIKVTGG